MSKTDQLIEYITSDIISYIMEDTKLMQIFIHLQLQCMKL